MCDMNLALEMQADINLIFHNQFEQGFPQLWEPDKTSLLNWSWKFWENPEITKNYAFNTWHSASKWYAAKHSLWTRFTLLVYVWFII